MKSEVQKQDRQFGLQGAGASAMSCDVTLRYLRDHWDAVLECEVYNVLSKIVKVISSDRLYLLACYCTQKPTRIFTELQLNI